jgi:membrane-associated protease RseP (regulator of RpoE activity)
MIIIGELLIIGGLVPVRPEGKVLYLHPVGFAGWVGFVLAMLNLLPAAMLDGGHIARSVAGDKARAVLTVVSVGLLLISDFWLMALFVLFLAMQRHPGPLDDVSGLSTRRKIIAAFLIVIFVLSFPIF